ncbi:hypothetical protein J3R82DRAFT_5880 [Butyriboletus roseoflavus]|nr:hypothetical protein J3R82DRAFT_5880 [Butyriboletus roseoflavus]
MFCLSTHVTSLPIAGSGLHVKHLSLQVWYGKNLRAKTRAWILFGAQLFSLTTSSFQGPQVRLVLNGATFPLSICEKSTKDKRYGTCLLDEFIRANEYSTSLQYKSDSWNTTCEIDG